MRAPNEIGGFEHFNTWNYQNIVPEERLEFTSRFADKDGNAIDPASLAHHVCPTSPEKRTIIPRGVPSGLRVAVNAVRCWLAPGHATR